MLLAKLLKNFRWLFLFALIHELLNKSINLSKVFKFVFTLFNLQGTGFAFCGHIRVRCELLYSSTSCRTCQELFSSFFEVFQVVSCAPSFRFSSRNFLSLSHFVRFVKNFFRFFSNFFDVIRHAFVPHSFFSIPYRILFVKNYFQVFPNFFRFGIFYAALADSFDILARPQGFVKHFFTN